MDDSLPKLSSSDMLETLQLSVSTNCSDDRNDRQMSRDVANDHFNSHNNNNHHHHHHYYHNPRHNHLRHNYNKYHHHHHKYYHNFHLESSSPSLSKSLHKSKRRRFDSASLGHRTHKRFEYITQEVKVLLVVILSLITLFSPLNDVTCLDSPVKVQRNKQQNKQQVAARQQPFSSVPQSIPNLEFVEDSSSRSSNLNDLKLNVTATATATARYGRARRTDERSHHHVKQDNAEQQCPSNKLSQSLLPPEYIGSPATSQRQHLSRAYCDCTVDLYGWHLTCFAGSAASQQRASNIGLNLPNQLHPAFRAPQLQRQQQQQQAAAAAASAATANLPNGRRIHRRSTSSSSSSSTGSRWMGDSSSDQHSSSFSEPTDKKNGDNIELADSNSNFSTSHEGSGEEVLSATPTSTNHQVANLAPSTTNSASATAKLKVRTINNSRSNFSSKPTPEEATNVFSPASNSEDGLMSLASSNSFALLQLQENSEQQQQVAARSVQQHQQQPEKPIINHSSSSSHITFQTIPVLFSVKYIRNNMIEIDCDQAAPHYKPAMFQGFNVNEIDSFTFNNCQLPNIPFSVLLHRTRPSSLPLPAAANSQQSQNNSTSFSNQPAAGSRVGHQQFLKPNRQRHQNLVRRSLNLATAFDEYEPGAKDREEAMAADDLASISNNKGEDLLIASSSNSDSASILPNSDNTQDEQSAQFGQPTSTSTQTQPRPPNFESKIKRLTVNLNTVVDQRTLISLLTGLDLLEDLQLNYMQLNLTNFEPDLEADPTSSATSSSADIDVNGSNRISSSTTNVNVQNQPPPVVISRHQTTSTVITPAISAPPGQHQTSSTPSHNHNHNANVNQQQQQHSLVPPTTTTTSTTSATSAATTSSSTTTMATPATQLLSMSSSQPTSTSSVMTNNKFNSPPNTASRLATVASTTTTSIPTTTTTASTTTPPTTATMTHPQTTTSSSFSTTKPTSSRNKQQQPNTRPSVQQIASSSITRSSISMGQPRGLVIAQATGIPTTQSIQTTTPSPSVSSTTVTSIPLSTVISSAQLSSLRSTNQQQQPTTNSAAGTRNTPLNHTTPTHGSLISIGSSQSQSVSYTSNTSGAGSYQNKPQTVTTMFSNNNNQPSSAAALTAALSTVGSNPINSPTSQLASPNRVHNTPASAWFQTTPVATSITSPRASSPSPATLLSNPANPPAGMRLTSTNNQQQVDSLIPAASNGAGQEQPNSSSPSSGSSGSTTSLAASTVPTLNTPINTPPFMNPTTNQHHPQGFGIRTSSSSSGSGPLPVSLGIFNGSPNSGFRPASLLSSQSVGLRGMNSNNNNNNLFTTPVLSNSGNSQTNNQNHFDATNNNINNNNLFHHHQTRRQQATTNANNQQSTPPTSAIDTSTHFVAAGGRLSSQSSSGNSLNRRQHQVASSNRGASSGSQFVPNNNDNNNLGADLNSATGTSNEPFEVISALNALSDQFDPTPTYRSQRFKRHTSDSSSARALEEFELSFGELLPNLRSLKLESFIDLSQLPNRDKQDRQNKIKPNSQRRFKRQFQPSDLPEKDEGHMSDSESDAIASSANYDSLQVEETNIHHNSVMANNAPQSSATKPPKTATTNQPKLVSGSGSGSRSSSSPSSSFSVTSQKEKKVKTIDGAGLRVHLDTLPADNDESDEELGDAVDQEPGEILMRSASSNSDTDMHDNSAAYNGDWSLPSSNFDPMKDEESDRESLSFNSARLRQFSHILVKLFSKLNKLRVLQLNSNDIPYWPDNVLFDSRNSLSRLYLISNNIRLLGKNSLANLTELETLDLSSNQLRQLNGDLFKDMSSLKNLRACRNLFRKLPSKLFSQIHNHHKTSTNESSSSSTTAIVKAAAANKLENVDFSKNRYLTQLSADMFAAAGLQGKHSFSFSPITSLNLSDCVFTDQLAGKSPEVLFASLPDLISVSLQHNKLRDLLSTNGLFAKNNKLQKLDFSHNQLNILSVNLFNANASQITDLQLHHNQLTSIPEQFLFNLKKLKRISLSHNHLRQLNASMFFTNQLIEFIDLSHNQLVTLNTQKSSLLPFGHGANLKFLNLAYNNLSQFEGDIFDISWAFYTNLNVLDLSHNQFNGQISMPIFYTIADEMLLNLASNLIQSVNVDALMQHEQTLDRYATFENDNFASSTNNNLDHKRHHQQQQAKLPTVNIKLTSNPIACDCLLEPLISYSRRVAAATNPSLLASIFPPKPSSSHHQDQNHPHHHNQDANLPAGSRYSVLNANDQAAAMAASESNSKQQQQPQLFYQFKFNDLYCAKPNNLERRLLSHISIGDLLCPIKDQRLCPHQCQCHYQSAFKTAIVDCNNKQLKRIPEQLTDSANFMNFNVESAMSLETTNNELLSNISISSVDKVIIRLDNNNLKSIGPLSKLFAVVQYPSLNQSTNSRADQYSTNTPMESHSRFARAPLRSSPSSSLTSSLAEPISESLSEASAQPLTSSADDAFSSSSSINTPQQQPQVSKSPKIISPVMIGRSNMRSVLSSSLTNNRQQRNKRASNNYLQDESSGTMLDNLNSAARNNLGSDNMGADNLGGADLVGTTSATMDSMPEIQPLNNGGDIDNAAGVTTSSTAVLESAEEFRNKRYPLTCELYLDHNMIEAIPESFLEALDQVKSSSMKSNSIPPQAALPTLMLEPPIHTKINNIGSISDSQPDGTIRGNSNNSIVSSTILPDSLSNEDSNEDTKLFGRHSLAPEKKAALFETISQNVRASQLKNQDQTIGKQQQQVKVSVSPSLVVLSLRYNNLSNINSKMLHRLSKLIKSSNTKLYLGHNPFNCSNNLIAPDSSNDIITNLDGDIKPEVLPVSPMGDQLIATSDATSGTYLENADDLSPSASSADLSTASALSSSNQLVPIDCPVGQLKTWLTRYHSSIGDLDELYCVHMPIELAEKLRLNSNSSSSLEASPLPSERLKLSSPNTNNNNKWEHDHPWASSLMLSSSFASNEARNSNNNNNATHISKNGFTWNSETLSSTARLIDVNMYDLCPYSGNQLLDASAISGFLSPVHQQVLVSVAIIFILISLFLLLMLVYFGDTQTILAFIYIHMNPIYSCLRLNESHLDEEKLYDAFVSYSGADRDIVLELIEKLERNESATGTGVNGSTNGNGYNANDQSGAIGDLRRTAQSKASRLMDRSHDTLVTEADLRPDLGQNNHSNNNNNTTLNRRTNSFQDLSTMSRTSSRLMMGGGDGYGGSALDMMNNSSSNSIHSGKNGMDEKDLPYRLCIHERDWLPGHLISWNIVNSVQNSRRTILILSKEFIKSVWFEVEFHTAYYQMLEDKIDRLIVIVRGELPPKNELDKNLAFLLTTKTYLTWGEKWFWERLHYALPHRSAPSMMTNKSHSKNSILGKQQAPVRQHHHHYVPKSIVGNSNNKNDNNHAKSSDLAVSLSENHSASSAQKPLIMSSIGKDCSNLLLPVHNNQAPIGSASSSASTSSSNTRSSSSFLSGTSTGNLLSPQAGASGLSPHLNTATTNNDLLSTTTSTANEINRDRNTARVTIGANSGSSGDQTSTKLNQDSGCVTTINTNSSISMNSSDKAENKLQSTSVTSIMVDNMKQLPQPQSTANSKVRAKKQERLQSFVDQKISDHFNLSEL